MIEILIVIAILGLLASIVLVGLGGARAKARDARRIADLRGVQNALEVYYATKGEYSGANDWAGLKNDLIQASIGITQIPNDPVNNGDYIYKYDTDADKTHYLLSAKLEQDNIALKDDIDNGDRLAGLDLECNDPIYCVQF